MWPWDESATYPGGQTSNHRAKSSCLRPVTAGRGCNRPLAGETLKMNGRTYICSHLKLIWLIRQVIFCSSELSQLERQQIKLTNNAQP